MGPMARPTRLSLPRGWRDLLLQIVVLAVALFVAQLVGNLLWTPLFFGAHQVSAAFLLIVAILGLTILTTFVFAQVRRRAAWLLVPYMMWLGFAGTLNWRIDQLNPDAERLVSPAAASQMVG